MHSTSRVLICDPIHQDGLNALRQVADVDIRLGLSAVDLQQCIGDYHALIVGPKRRIAERTIENGYKLRVIGRAGARLDGIDVSSARAMGIAVCHSPSSSAIAIAEHALSHMLLLAMKAAQHNPATSLGLAGKTLGIIGFGGIGQQVAQRALAFAMRVIVNQPRLTSELALGTTEHVDLIDLLRQADFVTLHVPHRQGRRSLIGAEELALMKETACLINTGHTDLVDDGALLEALRSGRVAGAAIPDLPEHIPHSPTAQAVRQHERVIQVPHATRILGNKKREAALSVVQQIIEVLQTPRPSDTLSLEVVPSQLVIPHEQIDDKRVARLMGRLEEDGRLVNPPVVTYWQGKYIVLDGATRSTALKRLNFPHVIVQVVNAEHDKYSLHTWYHVISSQLTVADLFAHLAPIEGLKLSPLQADDIPLVFRNDRALCYFQDKNKEATLAEVEPGADKLAVMNALVASYTAWGEVERTLLTDLPRLRAQFPEMVSVAVFPQFTPETVFNVASRGDLLPAGLTRFLIPGRILRLNADLTHLKTNEPLVAKRAWFNQFLEEKLAHSKVRYYQEPVVLLDE